MFYDMFVYVYVFVYVSFLTNTYHDIVTDPIGYKKESLLLLYVGIQWKITTPKINIEPENDGLEDDVPFPGVYSQVPCWSSGVYFCFAWDCWRQYNLIPPMVKLDWVTMLDTTKITWN